VRATVGAPLWLAFRLTKTLANRQKAVNPQWIGKGRQGVSYHLLRFSSLTFCLTHQNTRPNLRDTSPSIASLSGIPNLGLDHQLSHWPLWIRPVRTAARRPVRDHSRNTDPFRAAGPERKPWPFNSQIRKELVRIPPFRLEVYSFLGYSRPAPPCTQWPGESQASFLRMFLITRQEKRLDLV